MVAMAKSKNGTGSKKPNRSGVQLSLYVDEDIDSAMRSYIAEHNQSDEHPASVRSTVEASLKAYLKLKGYWPPKK